MSPRPREAKDGLNKRLRTKTRTCAYYFHGGYCARGGLCRFAHNADELRRLPHALRKAKLCLDDQLRYCPFTSEECDFAHGSAELRCRPGTNGFTPHPLVDRERRRASASAEDSETRRLVMDGRTCSLTRRPPVPFLVAQRLADVVRSRPGIICESLRDEWRRKFNTELDIERYGFLRVVDVLKQIPIVDVQKERVGPRAQEFFVAYPSRIPVEGVEGAKVAGSEGDASGDSRLQRHGDDSQMSFASRRPKIASSGRSRFLTNNRTLRPFRGGAHFQPVQRKRSPSPASIEEKKKPPVDTVTRNAWQGPVTASFRMKNEGKALRDRSLETEATGKVISHTDRSQGTESATSSRTSASATKVPGAEIQSKKAADDDQPEKLAPPTVPPPPPPTAPPAEARKADGGSSTSLDIRTAGLLLEALESKFTGAGFSKECPSLTPEMISQLSRLYALHRDKLQPAAASQPPPPPPPPSSSGAQAKNEDCGGASHRAECKLYGDNGEHPSPPPGVPAPPPHQFTETNSLSALMSPSASNSNLRSSTDVRLNLTSSSAMSSFETSCTRSDSSTDMVVADSTSLLGKDISLASPSRPSPSPVLSQQTASGGAPAPQQYYDLLPRLGHLHANGPHVEQQVLGLPKLMATLTDSGTSRHSALRYEHQQPPLLPHHLLCNLNHLRPPPHPIDPRLIADPSETSRAQMACDPAALQDHRPPGMTPYSIAGPQRPATANVSCDDDGFLQSCRGVYFRDAARVHELLANSCDSSPSGNKDIPRNTPLPAGCRWSDPKIVCVGSHWQPMSSVEIEVHPGDFVEIIAKKEDDGQWVYALPVDKQSTAPTPKGRQSGGWVPAEVCRREAQFSAPRIMTT